MKIWHEYGSEHSANLVMIGHFKDEIEATKAKEIIDTLTDTVARDLESGTLVLGSPSDRYRREMLDLLGQLNVASIGPSELEQFAYEVNVQAKSDKLILSTDEIEISAFLKVLFFQGARIELYSASDYPGTDYGRGK